MYFYSRAELRPLRYTFCVLYWMTILSIWSSKLKTQNINIQFFLLLKFYYHWKKVIFNTVDFKTNFYWKSFFVFFLQITHSTVTMQGPILVSRFRSVEVLELKRIPLHMLEGLHRLRCQIRTVIVSRCLNNLQVRPQSYLKFFWVNDL